MAKKAYVYDGSAWVEITSQPSVPTATTSAAGIVRLSDSTSSTLSTEAATSNAVKTAYDLASAVQSRTLTGTAPITVGGVSGTGQDLSANRTIAVTAATTSASGVVQIGSATPASISSTGSAGSASTVSASDHTHSGVTSITGTSNQVTASASAGAVTLSLPQSIATTSTPTFGATTINGILTSNQSGTLDLIEGIILQRTTSLSIATTTLNTAPSTANTTAITWSSAVKANTAMWTTGSAIVAPLAGWYAVNMNFQFGTGTSYAVGGYIFQGSTLRAHEEKQAGANTAADMLNVSAIIYCAANDSITGRVAASTTAKSITVTSQNGYFSMVYLGAQT